MKNNLLYIGINGLAGSGKDTIAKILKTILGYDWNSFEEFKEYYNKIYTDPTLTATFHGTHLDSENDKVICVAYADQLKIVCSEIFGIPLERFYGNKTNAWICINKKFEYTEIKPASTHIITADEYYYGFSEYVNNKDQYWLSLREILVYVGTYVLQNHINKNIFVNTVRNKILDIQNRLTDLKYVIVTDIRFIHELDFINENNGITISIVRESVEQLNNIAEHELDDIEDYDFIIDNSNGYDELLRNVWNMVKENPVFNNITYDLETRDNISNYIRFIEKENDGEYKWQICPSYGVSQINKNGNDVQMIDLIGGPVICKNKELNVDNETILVDSIVYDEEYRRLYIYHKL